MKITFLLLLILGNAATIFAQEKLEVFFDFNKFDLNEVAANQLTVWISTHQNIEVTKIYGFCDWKGSNLYNDTLSMKRVRTVSDFLKQHQIAVKDNFEVRGFGEDFKQSKVQSENRKVLVIYELKKEIKTSDPTAIGLQDQIKTSKSGDKIKLEKINFYNMSSRIVPGSQENLYELLCALQDNPKLKIEIQGHICCQPGGDINNLSVSRARAVYNYLVSQKIAKNRLSFKGFGVTRPIHPIPEKNEQQQDDNRRVEIMILGK